MIKVTLELMPGGQKFGGEHLGTIWISNDLSTTIQTVGKRGTYKYELQKKRRGRTVVEGRVENFPRLSYHPWNLILRILKDAAEKNGGVI